MYLRIMEKKVLLISFSDRWTLFRFVFFFYSSSIWFIVAAKGFLQHFEYFSRFFAPEYTIVCFILFRTFARSAKSYKNFNSKILLHFCSKLGNHQEFSKNFFLKWKIWLKKKTIFFGCSTPKFQGIDVQWRSCFRIFMFVLICKLALKKERSIMTTL